MYADRLVAISVFVSSNYLISGANATDRFEVAARPATNVDERDRSGATEGGIGRNP